MLDLNKLIGKIKKHFIESTLDAELDEHMVYQNMIKVLEIFLKIIEKEKLRKQYQQIIEKFIFKFQEMDYQLLNQILLKNMKETYLELEIKYFSYIKKVCQL